MNQEGPLLESLTHRLSECPAEFLAKPRGPQGADAGTVDVAAIVCDQMRAMGATPDVAAARTRLWANGPADENRARLAAVVAWLLHDEWFLSRPQTAPDVWKLLVGPALDARARLLPAASAVNDPDRREELVRVCLKQLGLRPPGESPAQAADRLNALDSVEREKVLRGTRAAEERARQIREAMAKKAAEEAAAAYGRE